MPVLARMPSPPSLSPGPSRAGVHRVYYTQNSNMASTKLPHIPRRISSRSKGDDSRAPGAEVPRARAGAGQDDQALGIQAQDSRYLVAEASDSDCATPTPVSAGTREQSQSANGTASGPTRLSPQPRSRKAPNDKGAVFELSSSSDSSDETLSTPPATELPPTTTILGKSSTVVFPATLSPLPSEVHITLPSPSNRPSPNSLRLHLDSAHHCVIPAVPNAYPMFHTVSPTRTITPLPTPTPTIRKKSGEPLKSSLKQRSSSSSGRVRPTLSPIVTDFPSLPSVSAPVTPTHSKFVHFDQQLEHVKLFLAEQKPLAVSRDGSPTLESTGESGTETEFPFNRQRSDDESIRKSLSMKVLNMPPDRDLGRWGTSADAEVLMENLVLSDDARSVNGHVRVKNLCFEKTVIARFTFDHWQTTSEVVARWMEGCAPANVFLSGTSQEIQAAKLKFDRFNFSIRLTDLFSRIEEKTLYIAVRYNAGGQEFWDSNGGQNYKITFERRKVEPHPNSAPQLPSTGAVESTQQAGEVAASNATQPSVPKLSPAANISCNNKTPDSLSSRYDFAAALKDKRSWRSQYASMLNWNAYPHQKDHGHVRESTYPHAAVPWLPKRHSTSQIPSHSPSQPHIQVRPRSVIDTHAPPLRGAGPPPGSPRDPDPSSTFAKFPVEPDEADLPFRVLARELRGAANGRGHGRRHQRSYCDSWIADYSSPDFSASCPGLRKTPPGTPVVASKTLDFKAGAPLEKVDGIPISCMTPTPGHHTPRSLSEADAAKITQAATTLSEMMAGARHFTFPTTRVAPGSCSATIASNAIAPKAMMEDGCGAIGGGKLENGEKSDPNARWGDNAEREGSLLTTTPTSMSSSPSASPTPSPSSPPDVSQLTSPVIQEHVLLDEFRTSPVDSTSYNIFLNKFCFYTGKDALYVPAIADPIRRSLSASSVEDLLSTPVSTSRRAFPVVRTTPNSGSSPVGSGVSGFSTPPRSSSYDSLALSRTPTPSVYLKPASPDNKSTIQIVTPQKRTWP